MKTKHTPGTWEHLRQGIEIQSEDGNHEVHAFFNGIPVPVCEVYASMRCEHDDPIGEYMISKQEGIANLLLIASAPDLLEALKDCEAALRLVERETGKSYAATIGARAAIAKATKG